MAPNELTNAAAGSSAGNAKPYDAAPPPADHPVAGDAQHERQVRLVGDLHFQ